MIRKVLCIPRLDNKSSLFNFCSWWHRTGLRGNFHRFLNIFRKKQMLTQMLPYGSRLLSLLDVGDKLLDYCASPFPPCFLPPSRTQLRATQFHQHEDSQGPLSSSSPLLKQPLFWFPLWPGYPGCYNFLATLVQLSPADLF